MLVTFACCTRNKIFNSDCSNYLKHLAIPAKPPQSLHGSDCNEVSFTKFHWDRIGFQDIIISKNFILSTLLSMPCKDHRALCSWYVRKLPGSFTPQQYCPSPKRKDHPRTTIQSQYIIFQRSGSSNRTFRISLFRTLQICWMSAALCETFSRELPNNWSSSFWFFDASTSTPGCITTLRTIFSPMKFLCPVSTCLI